jgi:hypothetical protein
MITARLTGLTASALGSLLQLQIIAATLPSWSRCGVEMLCDYGGDWFGPVELRWQPYIDNPAGGDATGGEGLTCANPALGQGPVAVAAPLPPGFDPLTYRDRDLTACVKLDPTGGVSAVRLLSGSGDPALDRALVRRISREWRFSSDGGEKGWHRVRLSRSGPLPF